jgi:hypothetical protein
MKSIEPIELEEFIKSTLLQVESAAEERLVSGGIVFEVHITASKTAAGGVKAHVISAGGEISNQQVQKINFTILAKRSKRAVTPSTKLIQRVY